jgi:hypothetical protein
MSDSISARKAVFLRVSETRVPSALQGSEILKLIADEGALQQWRLNLQRIRQQDVPPERPSPPRD